MSMLSMRDAFIAALEAYLLTVTGTPPFHDTINKKPKPTDDLWVTCSFYTNYNDDICYSGEQQMCSGTVDVSVFGKAGIGYTDVIRLCDQIETHFRTWNDNDFAITGTVPADEIGDGAIEGKFYGAVVSLEYMHVK